MCCVPSVCVLINRARERAIFFRAGAVTPRAERPAVSASHARAPSPFIVRLAWAALIKPPISSQRTHTHGSACACYGQYETPRGVASAHTGWTLQHRAEWLRAGCCLPARAYGGAAGNNGTAGRLRAVVGAFAGRFRESLCDSHCGSPFAVGAHSAESFDMIAHWSSARPMHHCRHPFARGQRRFMNIPGLQICTQLRIIQT